MLISVFTATRGGFSESALRSRPSVVCVEPVEPRRLASSTPVDGWTDIRPGTGATIVYVSRSAGNDSNSGLSVSSPVQTVARGISLMHQNTADQLLLARGDIWDESLGIWQFSGIDANQPMVIGAYGTGERPTLRTSEFALRIHSGGGVSHLALIGLHLQHVGGTAADGLSITGRADDLLVEDCLIEQYQNNIVAEASSGFPVSNVRVRRSVIVDAYDHVGNRNSEGAYFEAVNNIVLDQNVFDHNGWAAGHLPTIFNHDVYVRATCTGLVAVGNVFANASSHGLQARSGGVIDNNVFIDNPTGLSFGLVNHSPVTPGGVTGWVTNNAFTGGRDIPAGERGTGLEAANIKPGGTWIYNNLFTHGHIVASNSAAIRVASGFSMTNPYDAVGINDLYVQQNKVFDWGTGIEIIKGLHTGLDVATGKANAIWNLAHPNEVQRDGDYPWSLSNLQVLNNDIQKIAGYLVQHDAPIDPVVAVARKPIVWSGSRFQGDSAVLFTTLQDILSDNRINLSPADWAARVENAVLERVSYPSPDRSVGSYDATVGGAGSTDAFVAAARQQSRQNWNANLTAVSLRDYLFSGFDMNANETLPPPPPPTGGLPSAEPDIKEYVWTSGRTLNLTVKYSGGAGIDANTIGISDVTLSATNAGTPIPVSALKVADEGAGAFTATYTFRGPTGKWRKHDNGKYDFALNADQVKDTAGQSVLVGNVSRFDLAVGHSPKLAKIKKARLKTGHDGVQRLVVNFSSIVPVVEATDLSIFNAQLQQPLDPSTFHLDFDPKTHVAIWTFPGLSGGRLSGSNILTLPASGLLDNWKRQLDGNRDGVAGGDWVWTVNS